MHQLAAKAAEFPKPNLSRHHHRDLPGRQHRYQGHEPLPDKSKARFVRGSVVVLHVLGEVVPLHSRGDGVTCRAFQRVVAAQRDVCFTAQLGP